MLRRHLRAVFKPYFMQIVKINHSCFKLQAKHENDIVTVVTDPFKPEKVGLKLPKLEADIVTISHDHDDHNNVAAVIGNPFVISGPGEYEVKGVFIEGVSSYHDASEGSERGKNVMYRIELEGISITHLGDLGCELDNSQLEKLEGTDILIIPVGGVYTINAQTAVKVINQIEPRLVIPMHYHVSGLKLSKNLDPLDNFLKAIAVKPRYEEKLKIVRKDLPQDGMDLVVLN